MTEYSYLLQSKNPIDFHLEITHTRKNEFKLGTVARRRNAFESQIAARDCDACRGL